MENLEKSLIAVFANAWNLGGMVAMAEPDAETANRLYDVALNNALAELERAINAAKIVKD